MVDISKYKENIIAGMKYILERGYNIDCSNTEFAELEDLKYMKLFTMRYTVMIEDTVFDISGLTTLGNAKFILDNIDNIQYLYCDYDRWDTLLGSVEEFLSKYDLSDLVVFYEELIIKIIQTVSISDVENVKSKVIEFLNHRKRMFK